MKRILACSIVAASLIGCAQNNSAPGTPGPQHVVAPASPAQKTALFERMKTLAGTWEMADEKGKYQIASVFAVSSKDSAIREIMFPGNPYEMTNMYHMDGPSMLMVHYCAEGNQPRMRAVVDPSQPDRIVFRFDGVSNLIFAQEGCMGSMTLIFKDRDNIRQEWQSYKNGTPCGCAQFDLRRKKN